MGDIVGISESGLRMQKLADGIVVAELRIQGDGAIVIEKGVVRPATAEELEAAQRAFWRLT